MENKKLNKSGNRRGMGTASKSGQFGFGNEAAKGYGRKPIPDWVKEVRKNFGPHMTHIIIRYLAKNEMQIRKKMDDPKLPVAEMAICEMLETSEKRLVYFDYLSKIAGLAPPIENTKSDPAASPPVNITLIGTRGE